MKGQFSYIYTGQLPRLWGQALAAVNRVEFGGSAINLGCSRRLSLQFGRRAVSSFRVTWKLILCWQITRLVLG